MLTWIKSHRAGCLIPIGVIAVLCVGLYLAATAFPIVGAQGSDFLRSLIGDQATAQIEMLIFQVQDAANQVKYNLGLDKAAAPWQVTPQALAAEKLTPSPVPDTPIPSLTPVLTLTLTLTPLASFTPRPPTATSSPTRPRTASGSSGSPTRGRCRSWRT